MTFEPERSQTRDYVTLCHCCRIRKCDDSRYKARVASRAPKWAWREDPQTFPKQKRQEPREIANNVQNNVWKKTKYNILFEAGAWIQWSWTQGAPVCLKHALKSTLPLNQMGFEPNWSWNQWNLVFASQNACWGLLGASWGVHWGVPWRPPGGLMRAFLEPLGTSGSVSEPLGGPLGLNHHSKWDL